MRGWWIMMDRVMQLHGLGFSGWIQAMRGPIAVLLSALALAVAATAGTNDPPVDTSRERIAGLIEQLDGGSMGERVRAKNAYEQLQQIGPAAVPQLLEATGSESRWIRLWAMAALASTRDACAVEPALRLMEDPFFEVRKIATWHGAGLHELDGRIAPAVARRLADADWGVREWAQKALRERVKFRGAEAELEKMTHGDSATGRALAFKLLVRWRKKVPAAAVGKALAEDTDWRVRSAAVRALGEKLMAPEQRFFDLLFLGMADRSEEVKADAVEVMEYALKETAGNMSSELRAPIIDKLKAQVPPLLDAELPRLRGASLYLLAGYQGKGLYERALAGTQDPSPLMREYALRALGRCGVKSWAVVDRAEALLEDECIEVRQRALGVLCWATGARFEYDAGASPEKRTAAVKRIKARLEKARTK